MIGQAQVRIVEPATVAAIKRRSADKQTSNSIVSECFAASALERVSDEARVYLKSIKPRGWLEQIHQAFDRADKLNILFVGETIIDEYRYVSPLAKPSKEFILATVEAKEPEQFLGGVIAASLHGEWPKTKVCTVAQQITKTRFVDADFGRKLFEVYSKQRLELGEKQREALQEIIHYEVGWADVVVVLDFGHGLMGRAEREMVTNADFLAVNAQTNAGNYGFNPITKYSRAELICLDLPEAQLAVGERLDADEAHKALSGRGFGHAIITHGGHGSYCPQHIPAFASRVTDTMGAGDAFLAVTAPLVAAGLDLEAAAFVGNVAGAIKCETVGHRKHVGRDELVQAIESLLK